MNWHAVDLKTMKLLPNHADLIGVEYSTGENTYRVVGVCPLFPESDVEVENIREPGQRFGVSAKKVRVLLKVGERT